MQALLLFLVENRNWIYVILIVALLIYVHRLALAVSEYHSTIFGLERESAQHRLNSSLAMVVLLVLMIAAEFMIVTFVVPQWPDVIAVKTEVSGTETATPSAGDTTPIVIVVTATPEAGIMQRDENGEVIVVTQEPAALTSVNTSGCVSGELEWISPFSGEEISGQYQLMATVSIPDQAFFQYAYSPISDQQNWSEISADSRLVIEGPLGIWATDTVDDGDYVLRLTAYDILNNAVGPCDISVRVMNAEL